LAPAPSTTDSPEAAAKETLSSPDSAAAAAASASDAARGIGVYHVDIVTGDVRGAGTPVSFFAFSFFG
jgi:hypothetical protein